MKELEWYRNFADYVCEHADNIYNEACEWADKCEADG